VKPHPTIRKTAKWGGPIVSLALLAVIAWSHWWWLQYNSIRGAHFWLTGGSVTIDNSLFLPAEPTAPRHWQHARGQNPMQWFPGWHINPGGRAWAVYLPLWPAAAAAMLASAAAWRLDTLARRGARAGNCPNCNYNRTGLISGAVCPECGAAAPTSLAT